MDQQVLKVQKWLNSEYGKVSGYTKVNENGQTGWKTIYALREGLQHELGINPVSSGFGDHTKSALAGQVAKYRVGYKGNIAKLIQGAFWCKGYSPAAFNTKFSKDTQIAVDKLRQDAGLPNGNLTVSLMAALFDMSAFKLLGDGTTAIRKMQQYLNHNYLSYFGDDLGLVPTDGLYQRNTNTALIYALQAAEGMSTNQANGVYGPGTVRLTPTIYQGTSGPIVKVIQYGLMVNGFYDGPFDGIYESNVANAVLNFRNFMKLPPYNGSANLAVIKGLLTSNGDINRDSDACDTSFQVSSSTAKKLKSYGFNLIGRYLTGTVGPGADRRRKNLTTGEIEGLVNAGLKIFPIYQDNDGDQSYFTSSQGSHDANIATSAAARLGFPEGTTIYFAVDTDILDGDIPGTVLPYLAAVKRHLGNNYKVGAYGTRNVCAKALDHGYAVNAFVSDMSTGYSGNLGYKMPKNWAIDQFTEYNFAGIATDQDASSGRNTGTNQFVKKTNYKPILDVVQTITNNTELEIDTPITTVNFSDSLKVVLTATNQIYNLNSSNIFNITNGSMPTADVSKWIAYKFNLPNPVSDVIVGGLKKFSVAKDIMDGELTISYSVDDDGFYTVSFSINIYKVKINNDDYTTEGNLQIDLKIKPYNIPVVKQYAEAIDFVKAKWSKIVIAVIIAFVVIGGAILIASSPLTLATVASGFASICVDIYGIMS
ncbi:DUF1906 domain-containing protein [Fructilactobacillus ixorae]|uniref:DUF1906 domain-containing protein n=1 Tax=Fructilactobacillus ixorae TaxID=1750535 RepID=A0ABY5C7B6_9LACO|nr:glycoside hydrolase domain-containing protein [Fructilactobacillus ixorae]USS93498.1 DUF1906 domain-containing protein [Fructilactobacillus ixorae]